MLEKEQADKEGDSKRRGGGGRGFRRGVAKGRGRLGPTAAVGP